MSAAEPAVAGEQSGLAPRPGTYAPWDAIATWLLPVVIFAAIVGVWELGVFHRLLSLREFQLPFPSQILTAILERGDLLLYDAVVYTGLEAVVGLLVGGLLGFASAVLFASVPFLRRGALPIAASMGAIPLIAISPIAVLWLGFDQPSKIAVVALMTYSPMVVNAFKGLYSIDPQPLDLMDSLAASRWEVFTKLRLPASLPYVFSALKVGTTLAMIGALVAEFFNAAGGLGVTLSNNIQVAKMPVAWSAIVAAAVLGLLCYGAVSLVERATIPWHVSFRHTRQRR